MLQMPGARQHYLPLFLQRGFTTSEGSERTWIYWRDRPARKVGIRDVGVERDFYTDRKDCSIDDAITVAEREDFSSAVNRARHGTPGELDTVFPTLFAHLEVRTRNLRQAFMETTQGFVQKIMKRITESDVVERVIQRRWNRDPSTLLNPINDRLRESGVALPNNIARQIPRLARNELR